MTFFIRFVLVCIIIYLLIRSFFRFFEEQKSSAGDNKNRDGKNTKTGGVSKKIGEYVDYEEVD